MEPKNIKMMDNAYLSNKIEEKREMEQLNYWIQSTTLDNNTKKDNNMAMISLYDYLGRAAGPDLGKKVAIAASEAGVKSEIREVSHVGYKGPIMLYPRDFLDNFFGGGSMNEGGGSGKQLLKG